MSDLHYFQPDWIVPTDEQVNIDVCIFRASSSGVIAAIETVKLGKSNVLLQPGNLSAV